MIGFADITLINRTNLVKSPVQIARLVERSKNALMLALCAFGSASVQAKAFHDSISPTFRGTWASTLADCKDPDGVNQVFIDGESVNYYEGNDYLIIGVEFGGSTTKADGSGSLFNGRFTSRSEANLLGESNIRFEIDDRDKNVLYRYPIGDDGEPIATREIRNVRCPAK